MVGRILRAADFQRVLACAPWSRSTHFALHHLPGPPLAANWVLKNRPSEELSTGDAPTCPPLVDDLSEPDQPQAVQSQHNPITSDQGAMPTLAHWLGLVVPKRHARRSVTRSLLKRQMRTAMAAGGADLPPGLWVMRLKAGFDVRQFPSAASPALRAVVRDELSRVLQRAAARAAAPGR